MTPGSVLKTGSLERNERILKRHAQIVEGHDVLDLIGIQLGEVHRDVGASGMSYYGQMVIIRVRLDSLHFLDRKLYVCNAAQVLRLTADIELADFRHHRWIGRQIVLDANRYIATEGKSVRQKRVFGELYGVAMVEDRHRQLDHAGIGLHFLVAPYGDVHGDRTVVARWIVERQCLVTDRPIARGEVPNRKQRAKRSKNGNSTSHVNPWTCPSAETADNVRMVMIRLLAQPAKQKQLKLIVSVFWCMDGLPRFDGPALISDLRILGPPLTPAPNGFSPGLGCGAAVLRLGYQRDFQQIKPHHCAPCVPVH